VLAKAAALEFQGPVAGPRGIASADGFFIAEDISLKL